MFVCVHNLYRNKTVVCQQIVVVGLPRVESMHLNLVTRGRFHIWPGFEQTVNANTNYKHSSNFCSGYNQLGVEWLLVDKQAAAALYPPRWTSAVCCMKTTAALRERASATVHTLDTKWERSFM